MQFFGLRPTKLRFLKETVPKLKFWNSLYISRVSLIIKHAEYTGHALTMEGLKIIHAYNKFETDNISMLSDKKYWVKSTPYPLQIVSIKDWIKCRERVHAVSLAAKKNFGKYRKADKDLGTGIITCIECGSKYYTYENTKREKKYRYYKHLTAVNNNDCSQRPKNIKSEKANEIFKLFFFYNNYFIPQKTRQEEFLKKHTGNKPVEAFIAFLRREADLYLKYKQYYGYVFYIGKKIK